MNSRRDKKKSEEPAQYHCVVIKDIESNQYSTQIARFIEQQQFAYPKQKPLWAICDAANEQYFIVLTLYEEQIQAYSLIRERTIRFLGKSKFFIDGGPLLARHDLFMIHFQHLLKSFSGRGLWLKISPYITSEPLAELDEIVTAEGFVPRLKKPGNYLSTVVIDLELPLDEIRAGFRRSLKTQLNKSKKRQLMAKRCDSEDVFMQFVELLNVQARKKGFSVIEPEKGQRIFNSFLKNGRQGCFIVVQENQNLLGGLVLLAAGNRVIYEWGASTQDPEFSRLPIGHAMQWAAIIWSKEQGFRTYDFGGYWMERGDDDPINRFKTGFSKTIELVAPEYLYYFERLTGRLLDILSVLKNSCLR
ncbi:MAG: GNAT family N-acetyltransferase [Gammaproteobacteria bacterium]|nr:GNAT family N-acetyltransferase [Gammaproteobacteria bacterium]